MARYQYAGPGPHVSDEGEVARPGDVREFGSEPDWGPWECIDPPEASPAAISAAPALNLTPAPEGM